MRLTMSMARMVRRKGALLAALFLAGCATPPAPDPDVLPGELSHQNVRSAARAVALGIAQQMSHSMPGENRRIVLGNFYNAQTAELTVSGEELRTLLLLDLRRELTSKQVGEFDSGGANLDDAIIVQGAIRYQPGDKQSPDSSWFRVASSTRDGKSGAPLGEAVVLINARHFDPTPSRFYRDAPMYLTGRHHRLRLAAVEGKTAASRALLQVENALGAATAAYEKNDFGNAQSLFRKVLAELDRDNLVALSGEYQTLLKLGRPNEAEQAFGKLVDAGIAEQNLSFKLLFQVRSTEFRDDGDYSKLYPLWLHQIAKRSVAAGVCLNIVGHASKSGSAEYNEELSRRRAQYIAEKMIAGERSLKGRLFAQGRGFRENLIGSGTDDAQDAIDRRVEFSIVSCRGSTPHKT